MKVISRIIPWMYLINITVIFPLCLLSIMKNIKNISFILSDRWEDLSKKNQLLFHLQRINKVLGVGDGIFLWYYQGLSYQPHCFVGCSKTVLLIFFFLQLHLWFTIQGQIHNGTVLAVLSSGCKDAHHPSSYLPVWLNHLWSYCPRKLE